ncbi:MAG: hypothetical protein NW201_09240 [Gemmatimonadales bacterium]|nr:hypothetical protein [Gemmatimonadales bacterium]
MLTAVKVGPPWNTLRNAGGAFNAVGESTDFTARCLGLLEQRSDREVRPSGYRDPGDLNPEYASTDAPTYLPMLAALVLAASVQERGYYESLRKLLGLHDDWDSQQLEEVSRLWWDLEDWCSRQQGKFGLLKASILGGHRHVGMPKAHSMLSPRDLRVLPITFVQAGIRPGQVPTDHLLAAVMDLASEAPHHSTVFRAALQDVSYHVPLKERLKELIADWDGSVPPLRRGGGDRAALIDAGSEVELALTLSSGNRLPWHMHFRVPVNFDADRAVIRSGGLEWQAVVDQTGMAMTTSGPAIRELLVGECTDLDLVVFPVERDDVLGSGTSAIFVNRKMRSFVSDDVDSNVVLLEKELQTHRGAYLLVTHANATPLDSWLKRNAIHSTSCPGDGLPDGWRLEYVHACDRLDDEARRTLPDGERERPQPRMLRLVGGRFVRRSGLRHYLSYDLPSLEADVALDVEIVASDGLKLTDRRESNWVPPIGSPIEMTPSVRRFAIEPKDTVRCTFVLGAYRGGQLLEECRLRLVPAAGMRATHSSSCFVDRQGNVGGEKAMLRGVMMPQTSKDRCVPDIVPLSWELGPSDASRITSDPMTQFLDSLSVSPTGSLVYGTARDQIRRLYGPTAATSRLGASDVIRILRARGMIEVESDVRGRWVRVHAAPPCVYTLPIRSHNGWLVATVAGSPSLATWHALMGSRGAHLRCHLDIGGTLASGGPVLLFEASSIEHLRAACANALLPVVEEPCVDVASYSLHIDHVESALTDAPLESFAGQRVAERLNPGQLLFAPLPVDRPVVLQRSRELFRVEDSETGGHRLYSLGFTDNRGRNRFAFVRDYRWGVWIALHAFAEYARDTHHVNDAVPWPFEWSAQTRDFFVPARCALPELLERALVLCSGAMPERLQVSAAPAVSPEHLTLEWAGGSRSLRVSTVYSDMVPAAPEWATWLRYRHVPREVALAVAHALGGRLRGDGV